MAQIIVAAIREFWPAVLVLWTLLVFVMWIGVLFGITIQYNRQRHRDLQKMYIEECRKCKLRK